MQQKWNNGKKDIKLKQIYLVIVLDLPNLNKKVNPYKACSYGLCRDFLDGVGYDLGTKIYFNEDNAFWAKSIPFW